MSEARPPYVKFEIRAVEDRTATIEQGRPMHKDVDFAIITPAGSKDRIEKEAEAWLRDLADMVHQERFPATWLQAYKQAYQAFKENREAPEHGIPLADWPGVTPAQVNMLQDIGIRTVEHMAEATEEALNYIGMGARALKAKAQAYLDAAKDGGKTSEELAALRTQIEQLLARDKERDERLSALEKENETLRKAADKK